MKVKFVFEDVQIGGTETLCLRLAKYYQAKKIQTVLYCNQINETMRNQFREAKSLCVIVPRNERIGKYAIKDKHEANDLIYTFFPFVFIDAQDENNELGNDNRVILYILHFKLLEVNTKYQIVNKLCYPVMKSFVKSYSDNNNIVYMDSLCRDTTADYYSLSPRECANYRIIPIPYSFESIDKRRISILAASRNKQFNILAIARSEFPFKGYLIGLIKLMPRLRDIYNIHLTIISSGSNINDLRQECQRCSAESSIQLIENVPYESLGNYYKNSHLFVGMGSSLIEASGYGIVSIPVEPYTYSVYADHYFSDDPYLNCAINKGENKFLDMVKECINQSDEDFIDNEMNTYKTICASYSMEQFIKMISADIPDINISKKEKLMSSIFGIKDRFKGNKKN